MKALALWMLAVGVAFVALDPAETVRLDALLRLLVGGTAALAWLAAAIGAGAWVLSHVAPKLLTDSRGVFHAAVTGLLLWGFGALGLSAVGGLHVVAIVILGVVMLCGWLGRPQLRLPQIGPTAVIVGIAILLPGLIDTLAPPIDTDELYYHLALPQQMLSSGGLLGGFLYPDGSRPMAIHLPYACLLATGGDLAPRFFHLAITAGCLIGTIEVGRHHLGTRAGIAAALLLAGSWSFLHEAGLASNNLPVALAMVCALDAALRGEGRGLALATGTAIAIKYTAAAAAVGVFAIAVLPMRARAIAGITALALVAPWWLRNAMEGLHPLFPFGGWPTPQGWTPGAFVFEYSEKYGAGRGALDLLLLPYNVVMTARTDTFRFLGRINPAFLALAPMAVWAARKAGPARRIAIAAAIAGIGWGIGPHWLRYLLPALPILALACGAGLPAQGARWVVAGALACGLAGIPTNWGPIATQATDRLEAATGRESRDAFLRRHQPDWPAIAWANEHLPPDAQVALMFNGSRYLVARDSVLGSVEDHVPTRHWIASHGDRSVRDLAQIGITHVIVDRIGFIPKVYPFLESSSFKRLFVDLESTLNACLLRDATLVFQKGRTRVYRLNADIHSPAPS